jgi:hypothetical protein
MLLYVNYPRMIKAREKSPLDVIFHGLRYALLFWLGYGGFATLASATAVAVVFLFGVSGELLVGLRNQGIWRTTASVLGTATTVRVVNALTFLLMVLASIVFSQEVNFPLLVGPVAVPLPLIVGALLALFIMRPVSLGRSLIAPLSVRRRELVAIALVALVLVSTPALTRVNLEQPAPGPSYTVTAGMQTFVTGPNPWDGQWIIFNYQNPQNFYYVLLHTDGTLELARDANGTHDANLDDVQTGLSPFVWHRYQIAVVGGVATISIDGKVYESAQVGATGGEVLISQSFPHLNLWVVRVTELQVSVAG